MSVSEQYDAIIVGPGPAGFVASALFANDGLKTALVGPPLPPLPPLEQRDPRTIAMMRPSVRLLSYMNLWSSELKAVSSPLRRLRLLDDSGHSMTGTDLTFKSEELDDEPFGWNVPLPDLTEAFAGAARDAGVHFIHDTGRAIRSHGKSIELALGSQGRLEANIIMACDGRNSAIRKSVGIEVARWSYDQVAVGAVFRHSASHDDMSTECHRHDGPLTTVPMPDKQSSLVWMLRPKDAERLMALEPDQFARELQTELHGQLGVISDVRARKAFPMEGLNALTYAKSRVLLGGEAAHVVPPIGAQGLNMSLRDAATASELIGDAFNFGDDIGADNLLVEYDTRRRRDVWPRQKAIDLMNRTLLSPIGLVHDARALGLRMVDRLQPLRNRVMREGIAPVDNLPRAMQG